MSDLLPILIFVACVFGTFGLVRVCERLQPARSAAARAGNEPAKEAAR